MQCARHPGVETYVSCARCGTPICHRCQVHSDVGLRCTACSRAGVAIHPAHARSWTLYARGIGAALLVGAGGGLAVQLLAMLWPGLLFIPFLRIIVVLLLGYLVGEAVARATRWRLHREIRYMAGGGALIAAVLAIGPLLPTLYGILVSDRKSVV